MDVVLKPVETGSSRKFARSKSGVMAPKPRLASPSAGETCDDDELRVAISRAGRVKAPHGIRRSVSAPTKMMAVPSDEDATRELRSIFSVGSFLSTLGSSPSLAEESEDEEEEFEPVGEKPPRFSADPVRDRAHRASASPRQKNTRVRQRSQNIHRNLFMA